MALLYLRKELEKIKVRRSLERVAPISRDPTFNDIVKFSSPYVGIGNNHLLVLNVAKMVEFARQGADGVVNAICFNCMLGTASAAIASKIRKDCGRIPIPTFVFTGSELATEKTRLEAFVYQVHQFARRRAREEGTGATQNQ
jgi:predicted nucleotide-binding protein (sugar kinase/HSP70/actin superfamily)